MVDKRRRWREMRRPSVPQTTTLSSYTSLNISQVIDRITDLYLIELKKSDPAYGRDDVREFVTDILSGKYKIDNIPLREGTRRLPKNIAITGKQIALELFAIIEEQNPGSNISPTTIETLYNRGLIPLQLLRLDENLFEEIARRLDIPATTVATVGQEVQDRDARILASRLKAIFTPFRKQLEKQREESEGRQPSGPAIKVDLGKRKTEAGTPPESHNRSGKKRKSKGAKPSPQEKAEARAARIAELAVQTEEMRGQLTAIAYEYREMADNLQKHFDALVKDSGLPVDKNLFHYYLNISIDETLGIPVADRLRIRHLSDIEQRIMHHRFMANVADRAQEAEVITPEYVENLEIICVGDQSFDEVWIEELSSRPNPIGLAYSQALVKLHQKIEDLVTSGEEVPFGEKDLLTALKSIMNLELPPSSQPLELPMKGHKHGSAVCGALLGIPIPLITHLRANPHHWMVTCVDQNTPLTVPNPSDIAEKLFFHTKTYRAANRPGADPQEFLDQCLRDLPRHLSIGLDRLRRSELPRVETLNRALDGMHF